MEISKNDKLVQKLRCSSPCIVYQTLVEIRAKEVNSANGIALLRKRGILRYFVKLLQKPNEKILDVTLSILGNCCMETESCLELWRIGAVGPIVRILDGIGKDSIQGRTCRLLANLSQHQEIAAVVCREGAVPIIIEILKTNNVINGTAVDSNHISDMTKEMAVRALRLLGENPDCRGEIVNQGGVRAVAELILSDCVTLQKAALKALATLTQYCTDECALQVQGDGACFQRLVSFVEVPALVDESKVRKSPSSLTQSALTCLSNLARVPEMRPLLGNAGAINAVINQLQYLSNLDFNNEWKQRDLVSTLCLFSRESVNRMKLRDQGGLNQLMIHLKVDKYGPVAAALCNFAFDDNAFKQLVDHGLIHVCADQLRDAIAVKLKESRRSHTFLPRILPRDDVQKRRNSLQIPNSSPVARSRYRQTSVEDSYQSSPSANPEIKTGEGCGKKLSKSPGKISTQKTFRISSPSYQAVCFEQEGHRNTSSWSPPSVSSNDWNGSSCASAECNLSSGSIGGASPWAGASSSFSFGGYFQSQNPISPMPLPTSFHQFQDGPLSPEASSCSGGSSSSCTSGYASSPRSDLSDAPSPGTSTAASAMDEVYSPVYEDVSDDSGQEDCEGMTKEQGKSTKHTGVTSNKRVRSETNEKNEDMGVSRQKKKCSSLLKSEVSESSFSFEQMQCSLSIDEKEPATANSAVEEGDTLNKDEHQGNLDEESEKPKNKKSLVDYLFVLLSHASQFEEPIEDLASYNTFSALLGFHLVNPDPRSHYSLTASRILSRIVRNDHYLIPLINQRFVLTVRSWFCSTPLHKEEATSDENLGKVPMRKDVRIWQKCSECHRLRSFGTSILLDLGKSAESGYGEGELAYGLLKGDSAHRMAIALSLPFIIRSKKMLSKLLLGCNGLIALLGILKDFGNTSIKCDDKSIPSEKCGEENEDKDEEEDVSILNAVVDGLSYLAEFVGMKVIKNHSLNILEKNSSQPDGIRSGASTSNQHLEKINYQPNGSPDEIVFALDDGSSIVTSREGMSNISPVFRAMLQGNFVESEGMSVKLPGVSHSCLSYIMHHLGECRDIECIKKSASTLHSLSKNINGTSCSRNACHWADKPKEVYGALELVSIADRFLLPDVFCKKLANQVLDYYLCPESAAKIYMWCLGTEGICGSRAPEDLGLLEGTVKYILVGCMTLDERVTLIQSLFSRGFGGELVSHMNDLIRIYFE
ncbi:uncharacterized protein Rnb [Hetaerina americana]|uniref:uncharacterized protein Rnb n=1 Tax=Hetaerina americana TaxID=62018 RepID=UPI003A7F5AD1